MAKKKIFNMNKYYAVKCFKLLLKTVKKKLCYDHKFNSQCYKKKGWSYHKIDTLWIQQQNMTKLETYANSKTMSFHILFNPNRTAKFHESPKLRHTHTHTNREIKWCYLHAKLLGSWANIKQSHVHGSWHIYR